MRAVWDDDGITISYFYNDLDTGTPYTTPVLYVSYTSDGLIESVQSPGGETYTARSFFSLPFHYTLYDCNAVVATLDYSDVLT